MFDAPVAIPRSGVSRQWWHHRAGDRDVGFRAGRRVPPGVQAFDLCDVIAAHPDRHLGGGADNLYAFRLGAVIAADYVWCPRNSPEPLYVNGKRLEGRTTCGKNLLLRSGFYPSRRRSSCNGNGTRACTATSPRGSPWRLKKNGAERMSWTKPAELAFAPDTPPPSIGSLPTPSRPDHARRR